MSLEIARSYLAKDQYFLNNPDLFMPYTMQTMDDEDRLSINLRSEYLRLKYDLTTARFTFQQAVKKNDQVNLTEAANLYVAAYARLANFKQEYGFTYVSTAHFYNQIQQTTIVEEEIAQQLVGMQI